jgi:hypothetical protein
MRNLFLICLSLALIACGQHNESYYRKNPQALEKDLKKCPLRKPKQLSCEQLVPIAISINELAYQLQTDPQRFGRKILSLQENLTKKKADLLENPNQTELKDDIHQIKQQLVEHLAIVKWLESPES